MRVIIEQKEAATGHDRQRPVFLVLSSALQFSRLLIFYAAFGLKPAFQLFLLPGSIRLLPPSFPAFQPPS